MDNLLMRASEVAVALGVGRATAYELMASGELPTVRIGRAVRVPRAELERWVRQQTTGHAADAGRDAAVKQLSTAPAEIVLLNEVESATRREAVGADGGEQTR